MPSARALPELLRAAHDACAQSAEDLLGHSPNAGPHLQSAVDQCVDQAADTLRALAHAWSETQQRLDITSASRPAAPARTEAALGESPHSLVDRSIEEAL